jgi:hypothetical protein
MVPTSLSMLPSRGKLPTQHEPDTKAARTQPGNGTHRLPRQSCIIPTALVTTARVGVITPSRVQDTAVLRVTLITPTRRPSALLLGTGTKAPSCWLCSWWWSSSAGTGSGQSSTNSEPLHMSLCVLTTPVRTHLFASSWRRHGKK